jgi:hypothetical protein
VLALAGAVSAQAAEALSGDAQWHLRLDGPPVGLPRSTVAG